MKSLKCLMTVAICALGWSMLAHAGPVDINSADAETISAELEGIGLTKAMAIVDYRKTHGPFKSVDDLIQVKGIGARTVEINRRNILLEPVDKAKKK